MKKEVITVFTAKKARQLLKEGFTIVDIKPDRLDPDHKRTLFLFKNENGLMEKIIEQKILSYLNTYTGDMKILKFRKISSFDIMSLF